MGSVAIGKPSQSEGKFTERAPIKMAVRFCDLCRPSYSVIDYQKKRQNIAVDDTISRSVPERSNVMGSKMHNTPHGGSYSSF
jgi:hypothetical protein